MLTNVRYFLNNVDLIGEIFKNICLQFSTKNFKHKTQIKHS